MIPLPNIEHKPQFTNDHEGMLFLGHYFDMDVYIAEDAISGKTLIARYGNEGSQYASCPYFIFIEQLNNRSHRISGRDGKIDWGMPFQDYLFSDKVIDYYKAMLLGLATYAMKSTYDVKL